MAVCFNRAGDGIFGQPRDETSLPRFFLFSKVFSFFQERKKLEPMRPVRTICYRGSPSFLGLNSRHTRYQVPPPRQKHQDEHEDKFPQKFGRIGTSKAMEQPKVATDLDRRSKQSSNRVSKFQYKNKQSKQHKPATCASGRSLFFLFFASGCSFLFFSFSSDLFAFCSLFVLFATSIGDTSLFS